MAVIAIGDIIADCKLFIVVGREGMPLVWYATCACDSAQPDCLHPPFLPSNSICVTVQT